MLRTDNVAAPDKNLVNLAVSVENRSVFDENWGVLDENLRPAGLPAWPAFRPNIIPKEYPKPNFKPNITIHITSTEERAQASLDRRMEIEKKTAAEMRAAEERFERAELKAVHDWWWVKYEF